MHQFLGLKGTCSGHSGYASSIACACCLLKEAEYVNDLISIALQSQPSNGQQVVVLMACVLVCAQVVKKGHGNNKGRASACLASCSDRQLEHLVTPQAN
eukprot:1146728-Pelagomonas_calceolata.AAC.4